MPDAWESDGRACTASSRRISKRQCPECYRPTPPLGQGGSFSPADSGSYFTLSIRQKICLYGFKFPKRWVQSFRTYGFVLTPVLNLPEKNFKTPENPPISAKNPGKLRETGLAFRSEKIFILTLCVHRASALKKVINLVLQIIGN